MVKNRLLLPSQTVCVPLEFTGQLRLSTKCVYCTDILLKEIASASASTEYRQQIAQFYVLHR